MSQITIPTDGASAPRDGTTEGAPPALPGGTTRVALPAALVLAGAFLSLSGWAWDIQWHNDVGPDTFFTAPHLFLYIGSAVCGITALTVVLRTTAAQRSGAPVDPAVGGRAVGVFRGRFTAPVGYLVVGVFSATFLLYGVWDQWWHSLYGFDAQLNSPPHFGLLFGNFGTIIGALLIFAAARHQRWGRAGVIASATMLVAFTPILTDSLQQVSQGLVDWGSVAVACLTTSFLLVVLVTFRRGGAVLLSAAALAVLQGGLWLFTPWATETYAGSLGVLMREFTAGFPIHPSWIPTAGVVVAALLLEGLRARARSREWSARVVAPVAGAVGSGVIAVLGPIQGAILYGVPLPGPAALVLFLAPSVAAAVVLGALAGVVGWRLGEMVRALAPAGAAPTAAAPAVEGVTA